jgi:hypothetical protein
MTVDGIEESFERHAVMQILAGVEFVGDIDSGVLERIENGPPAFRQLRERGLGDIAWASEPRVVCGALR